MLLVRVFARSRVHPVWVKKIIFQILRGVEYCHSHQVSVLFWLDGVSGIVQEPVVSIALVCSSARCTLTDRIFYSLPTVISDLAV